MLLLLAVLGVFLPLTSALHHVTSIAIGGKTGPSGCGMFEEYRRCGPACPPTCDSLREMVCCEMACIAGCFCMDGYILKKDATTGHKNCIPIDKCPSPGILSFERPTFSVLEGSGKAIIPVVRLNGSYGLISTRYRVIDPAGPYAGLVGVLEFPDGVVTRTIEIPLQDNAARDQDLKVQLELFEPSRRTGIDGRSFALSILDDDMNPGYLELEKTEFSVPENEGSVKVKVFRHEGTDGQLRVKYHTVPDTATPLLDFSPVTGELVFEEGETSKTVTIKIVDDEVRESPEKFKFELFDFSHGPRVLNFRRGGSFFSADITIIDNDMRPGMLQFERPSYSVYENARTVDVDVIRMDGQEGEIEVGFETRPKTAEAGQDFEPQKGKLYFKEGERRKTIRINIVDDIVREPEETFEVLLLDSKPGPDTINFRGLGPIRWSTITILDDDMSPGYLELEKTELSVLENVGSLQVKINRREGSDGQLRVKYHTVPDSASPNLDFSPVTGELVFEPGENSKTVTVSIVDDEVREVPERFKFELFDFTHGPGVLNFRGGGSIFSTDIIIIDNDMRPGMLAMERPSYKVYENDRTVEVSVIRIDGQDGQIEVGFETRPKTAEAGQDFEPQKGKLVFKEGELRKTIRINIVDDAIREPEEKFDVLLLDPMPGPDTINFRGLGQVKWSTITIIDDDMNPGVVQLDRNTYEVMEDTGKVVVEVVRVGGQDGQIKVQYHTKGLTATEKLDFVPASGELIFEERETRKTIVVQINDDAEREPLETFEIELFNPTPGPGIVHFRGFRNVEKAIIKIRDNDMTPGILQFKRPSYEVMENVGTMEIEVVRKLGSDGEIRVKYKTVAGTAIANQDFVPAEGELVFEEGETRKDIAIQILNDQIREPTKSFEVELMDPTAGEGVINFRRFTTNPTTVVSIRDDDMEPGVLQMEEVVYQFFENVGTVKIPVVRMKGSEGQVRVFYRTVPKTALTGADFEFASGELVFKEGETKKFIEINLVNDNLREETKSFEVELLNPEAAKGVINFRGFGQIQKSEVYILDDDMAPGLIEMEQSAYVVPENAGQVPIGVVRLGGKDGQISVQYRTVARSATPQTDFLPAEGELVFEDGENRKFIVVQILNDNIREPSEMFEVQLFNPKAEKGLINFRGMGMKPTAVVTIQDDDIIPGYLEVDRPTYFVNENVGTVQVMVVRRDGSDGPIRCRYQSRPKTATAGTDFAPVQGELVFEDGETSKIINVQILDDRVREPRESFEIVLLEPNQGLERVLGPSHLTEVVISDDDMTPGIVELEETNYVVSENEGILTVVVKRIEGKDGQLRVGYVTSPKTALPGFDFVPIKGELVFEDGETKKAIQIQIRDDNKKEPVENFEIELVNPGQGLIFRSLGQKNKALVTINDDDWTPGVFEFEQESYMAAENVGTLNLVVIRKDGLDGQVRMGYRTVPGTAQPSTDFQPLSGELVFDDGETKKTIPVSIVNDGVREPTETFEIELLDPTPPQGMVNFRGLGQKHKTVVTIFDDDGNTGFLELEEPTYVVSEGINNLQVVVNRRGGSDGRIQCRYQTTAKSALAGIDFEPRSGELIFEDGETQKIINIPIVDDNVKESIKTFEIQLLDPLPAPGIINFRVVGSRMRSLISIADDDIRPGLVQMVIPSFIVKESVGTINIPVIRKDGSDGTIKVKYQAVSKTAQEGTDFAPLSGELVFEDGENRKVIHVQILNDNLKEPTETFEVQLMDARPGPGVLNFDGIGVIPQAVITIPDDDMNHGFLEVESPSYHFSEGSGTGSIRVIRMEGTDGTIHVRYQTVPKTAIPGTDYVDTSGELVFEDGVRMKDITVEILNDHRKEATKTFEVQLFEASIEGEDVTFRALGSRSVSLVSIWDDDRKI